ncbi:hypothetical protein DL96DRAFT_758490 [Flagelloscypha sp. PMI_526]|nr:hypothetical protein DL96DRAFT_758490 [Flagelloscypha sp. PMI_526]
MFITDTLRPHDANDRRPEVTSLLADLGVQLEQIARPVRVFEVSRSSAPAFSEAALLPSCADTIKQTSHPRASPCSSYRLLSHQRQKPQCCQRLADFNLGHSISLSAAKERKCVSLKFFGFTKATVGIIITSGTGLAGDNPILAQLFGELQIWRTEFARRIVRHGVILSPSFESVAK